MTLARIFGLAVRNVLLTSVVGLSLGSAGSTGYAAGSELGAPLCGVLKKLLQEVKTFKPEGARAQLVMAIAEQFDYDAAKLRQVKMEIDQATTASCPKDRDAWLGILKMKSLKEAVS